MQLGGGGGETYVGVYGEVVRVEQLVQVGPQEQAVLDRVDGPSYSWCYRDEAAEVVPNPMLLVRQREYMGRIEPGPVVAVSLSPVPRYHADAVAAPDRVLERPRRLPSRRPRQRARTEQRGLLRGGDGA